MEVTKSQAAGRRRNSRVLVVEDNKSQLRTLTAILEDEGFDTIGCSTATEALRHVGQEDVAVAIVDLRLPALSGTELLKRFQELDDGIPVVVHTAHASYASAKDAINHGAFAYVEKACDPDEIVRHVRRAFQQHLEQYADELETAVAERTRELQEACEELGSEIDRRERAAEALERNEALLATILEAAPAGIGLLHDRVFQWVNIPMLEMTGYSEDELLGQNAQMLYETAEEYERVGRVKYAQIRATGTGEIDTQWRRKDGKTIHVHLRSTAINPEDMSAGVIFTATDITERRLADDQRRQLEADLAHIGRVHTVGEMAATLAHEINQPLYAIANYVRGVNRRINRGNLEFDQLADVMGRVSHEVDRAAGIISHLREFVRKGRPRRSTVDVKRLVDDVMKLLEADIRRNRITVNRQLDDDIPVVSADPIQIQQVVVNLIRNAVDAMSEVPDERRVLTIAARSTGDKTVEIAVSDNGKDLPTEIADNIFDAFVSTKDEGLGIGLAISRTIVEAHDGRLWAVPNQPQRTTFFFTIPPISEGPEDELEAHSISRG